MTPQDKKLAEEILDKILGFKTRSDNFKKEVIEAMQAYHEVKMREEKVKKFYDKNTCVVCHQNYVDSANGFDTCGDCLSRI